MDIQTALEIFSEIKRYYDGIKPPKYRNADFETLKQQYAQLMNLKKKLDDNADYVKLINAISQVISPLDRQQMLARSGTDRSSHRRAPCCHHHTARSGR